jgi:hypothetical protein
MAWAARVISRQRIDGIISVAVEFTDGTETIREIFRTSVPTADWIPNEVRDRIAALTGTDSFSIPLGSVTPSASVTAFPRFPYFYNIPSQVHEASANAVHWDLFNAHSSLLVKVLSIRQIPDIVSAVTGVPFAWKLAWTTSVGAGGSALTSVLSDLSQSALDADVTCRSKPTSGASEGVILRNYNIHGEETNTGSIVIAALGGLELVPQIIMGRTQQGILLRQNQGLRCVQITNSVAGNTGWLITLALE